MATKGPKMAVFWPWRTEFCKNKKRLRHSLTFTPREAVYQISEKFGSSNLEKMRYERTNGQTDGTEIIGPSGKIPGTKNQLMIFYQSFLPSLSR